jgi:hypothetical protein
MSKLILVGVESPVTPLELVMSLSAGKGQEAASAVTALVERFVGAGRAGGYTLPSVAADRSRLELVPGVVVGSDQLTYRLEAKYVTGLAFQILRLMVGTVPGQSWAVGTILVREPRPGPLNRVELPLPDDENEDDVYPEMSVSVPIAVDWVETQFSWSRRCLVEFASPVQPNQLQAVKDRVNLWWALVEARGFVLPTDFPIEEILSTLGDVTQFDEFTIEIAVDRFHASEAAWEVLVSLLDAYSRSGVPIVNVDVE